MTTTSIAAPAAPAPANPAGPAALPAAGQGIAADFLLMLGQLVAGTAPQQGGSGVPAQAVDVQGDSDDATSDALDPEDVGGLIPLSLPLVPPPPQTYIATHSVTAPTAGPVGQADALGSSTVASQAQIVTQLIGPDEGLDEATPSFDIPPLPVQPRETHAASTAQPETALARPVHAPVGSRAWADEIGSRVVLMAEHGRHTASLRLSPEHLGPLEIQVTMHDDQASVWFGAAHADTRAAIETALPRLRELFASQGLSLADAGVFREPPQQQGAPAARVSPAHDTAPGPEPVIASQRLVRLGLIDAYA